MNWLQTLFVGGGIAHSILILAIVIALGTCLGKVKVLGISLGGTWILFVGILASHFGFCMDKELIGFVKEFGLILFIFSIGLQVGPGFFSSFKKGGVSLNLLAVGLVVLGVITTLILYYATGIPMETMVGVMSGAVTNTPGLGAAQNAFSQIHGVEAPSIAMGYAVAYPLGVIGVILSLIGIRYFFKVNISKESEEIEQRNKPKDSALKVAVEVRNEAIFGKTIYEIDQILHEPFIISRLYHQDGTMEMPVSGSVVNKGDKLLIVTSRVNESVVTTFIGKKIEMEQSEWEKLDTHMVSRRLIVTKSNINGKQLGELNIRAQFGINITRINRAGVDLLATPELQLQLGDRVMVVGSEKSIEKVADLLGNSLKKLREPNLIPIFLGIFLGVLLGSVPFAIPGLSQPLKLGLAGGPLIVAILIARFGPKYHIATYTTMSANMFLREVGISLFLAAVGLGAGEGFVDAIVNGGYMWILYGLIITVVPVLIITMIGRYLLKLDYFSLSGLVAGTHTNPIALSFLNNTFGVPQIAVVYATVYPLAMFLRVLVAQMLIS